MIRHRHRRSTIALLALMSASLAAPALMAEERGADQHDQDRARQALEHSEVRPIADVLAAVTTRVPGEVVGVELEREHGNWVYEIKVIASDGRLLEVMVEAATARVIDVEAD